MTPNRNRNVIIGGIRICNYLASSGNCVKAGAFRRKPWLPGSLVSSYETGERQPSLAMLVALADIYRVPTDYLLGRRGANPELDLAGLSQQEIEALRVIVEAMRRD